MDALTAEASFLAERMRGSGGTVSLEVGCGTGILSAFAHTVLTAPFPEKTVARTEPPAAPSAAPAVAPKSGGRDPIAASSADSPQQPEQKQPQQPGHPAGGDEQQQQHSRRRARASARGCFSWATDINPKAAQLAAETFRRNGVAGDVVEADLLGPLEARLRGAVDVLLFNPPYVPSEDAELAGTGISRAWAGGSKGRDVLDRLLPRVPALLSARGVFYVVALHPANDVGELNQRLFDLGLVHAPVLSRQAGIENLHILRYARRDPRLPEHNVRPSARFAPPPAARALAGGAAASASAGGDTAAATCAGAAASADQFVVSSSPPSSSALLSSSSSSPTSSSACSSSHSSSSSSPPSGLSPPPSSSSSPAFSSSSSSPSSSSSAAAEPRTNEQETPFDFWAS